MIEVTLDERQDYFQSNPRLSRQKSSCSFPPLGIEMLIGCGSAAARRTSQRVVSLVSVANCCSNPYGKAPEGPKDNSRGRKPPDRILHLMSPGRGERSMSATFFCRPSRAPHCYRMQPGLSPGLFSFRPYRAGLKGGANFAAETSRGLGARPVRWHLGVPNHGSDRFGREPPSFSFTGDR